MSTNYQKVVDILRAVCYTISNRKGYDIMAKNNIRSMALCSLCTAIIAVCSQIMIPLTVPFTMQTFAVFCALGILGGKWGTVSVLLYILLGAVGVPVFAEFTGGLGIILGTTGGYIVGFLLSALAYWGITKLFGNGVFVMAAAMAAGLLLCYAFGTVWFMAVYARDNGAVGLATALSLCVFPFIIPDAVKISLAILISRRVSKYAGIKGQPA